MTDVWRMEDADGHGPFNGIMDELFGEELFNEFLRETVGKSQSIRETRDMTAGSLFAELRWLSLKKEFGREPLYGAPDRECFERWFPLKFRLLYGEHGYRPYIYTVPASAVWQGASVAEVMFIPKGTKRLLDLETLEPVLQEA